MPLFLTNDGRSIANSYGTGRSTTFLEGGRGPDAARGLPVGQLCNRQFSSDVTYSMASYITLIQKLYKLYNILIQTASMQLEFIGNVLVFVGCIG